MEATFSNTSDICQQLLDRYSNSSAQQHRHLCATAAATRSLIHSESLPLTPFSYFAAAISTLSDQTPQLEPDAFAALSSFLTIVLPLVPEGVISPDKAVEAVEVVAEKINGDVNEAFLGTATVRALIKSLGVLLGFCNVEDWDSIKPGFSMLLSFSIDKRPKVRKCAQDCLVALFKSLGSSGVIKEASKLVYSFLKEQMLPVSKAGVMSVPDNQEFVHTLNVLKVSVPHLSDKLCAKVLDQLMKLLRCELATLSKHVFEIILVLFESSTFEVTDADARKLLEYLVSYISLKDKHPLESVLCAASLSRCVIDNLHTRSSTEWISLLPIVIDAVAGLLSSEAGTALQASTILKGLINQHVDENLVSATDGQLEDEKSGSCMRLTAVKSICGVFDDLLIPGVVPNEYFLVVVSTLFLRLGEGSGNYMKSILAKLAEVMNSPSVEASDTENFKKCIGNAVVAMGPKNFLTLLPISLSSKDFSCSNMWVLPILKEYVVGSSLQFFMEYFVTLADSFEEEAQKVGRSEISKKLEVYANKCWELLPAFCRFPKDMHKNFTTFAKFLVPNIKDSPVLEIIAVSLQELVNQNKQILACDGLPGEKLPTLENIPENCRSQGSYSKKIAKKNIRALASCSEELLQALVDVFMEVPSDRQGSLKDAIGCLASISDSSMIKDTFLTSLKKLKLIKDSDESLELESLTNSSSENKESEATSTEKDAERCLVLKLGSCFADWANDELVNFLFQVTCHSLEVTEGTGLLEAYQILGSILEKHAAFCSSQFVGVLDLLLKLKSPSDIASLRCRFNCLRTLMIHALKENLDEENTKAFLILNEIIIALKDSSEEGRKAAYDILAQISASLRSISSSTSEGIYQKLINMVMGYLVDSSPHIKSGAVSALSVLVYSDTDVCVIVPELVPSVLRLLQDKKKVIEVVKAVLGFVKVLVSDLQAKDLRKFLPDIINGILPWASKSRYHFKLKVTIILEIMTRKCGAATVKSLVPPKDRDFLESVLENRHGKTSSKGTSTNETDTKPSDSSKKGWRKRTHEESTILPKEGSKVSRKRPREGRQKGPSLTNSTEEPNKSSGRAGTQKSVGRNKDNPNKQRSQWQGRNNKETAPKTQSGEKRKMHRAETTKKDKSGRSKPAAGLSKIKGVSTKRLRVEK